MEVLASGPDVDLSLGVDGHVGGEDRGHVGPSPAGLFVRLEGHVGLSPAGVFVRLEDHVAPAPAGVFVRLEDHVGLFPIDACPDPVGGL